MYCQIKQSNKSIYKDNFYIIHILSNLHIRLKLDRKTELPVELAINLQRFQMKLSW